MTKPLPFGPGTMRQLLRASPLLVGSALAAKSQGSSSVPRMGRHKTPQFVSIRSIYIYMADLRWIILSWVGQMLAT